MFSSAHAQATLATIDLTPLGSRPPTRRFLFAGALCALLLGAGCTKVGPDFVKPDAPVAASSSDTVAQGGQIFTYPMKGQSQEQHDHDQSECSRFAIESIGFDPQFEAEYLAKSQKQLKTYMTSPAPDATRGGVARGSALGALAGALTGGIAGDAGGGAAIGATAGLIFGGFRRRNARHEYEQWELEQIAHRERESQRLQADFDQGIADYERAFSVCMRARDYEVM